MAPEQTTGLSQQPDSTSARTILPQSATRMSASANRRPRFHFIDLAKAISIYGVVFIHSDRLFTAYEPLLSPACFRFCVPVFIMASFFLAEAAMLRAPAGTAYSGLTRSRLIRLAIPFFFWSILYALIFRATEYPGIIKYFTRHFTGYGWAGQYYFLVLGQLTLLYPVLRGLASRSARITLVSWLVATGALVIVFAYMKSSSHMLKVGAVPCLYWIWYALCGICLARNYERIRGALGRIPLKVSV